MKSKLYKSKHMSGKTYMKSVGNGFEAGFMLNGMPVFVGNFIHAKEANLWFGLMNREIRHFSKKYSVGSKFPKTWFAQFVKNHLYKTYYSFLDRLFVRYSRDFGRAVSRHHRKYQQIRKQWHSSERVPFLKAA